MGVNLRSPPLIWPLNSILPRGFPPENRPGRLNRVCVSPVNELPDDPRLPYSRLTAPVDFKWTPHHSHCPAPQRLSAVSGEMVLEGLKIRQLMTSMRLLSGDWKTAFHFLSDVCEFDLVSRTALNSLFLCVYVWRNLLNSWNLGLRAVFVCICQVTVRCIMSQVLFCFHWIVIYFMTLAATKKDARRCKRSIKLCVWIEFSSVSSFQLVLCCEVTG